MKNFNRMIAFLLAAAMTMGMSLTAMAEGTANEVPETDTIESELPEADAEGAMTITITAPQGVNDDESRSFVVQRHRFKPQLVAPVRHSSSPSYSVTTLFPWSAMV